MMDNTPATKCRKSPKNRHIRPPFSPFYLRKCLTNSGRYILSQGTEENSNPICSLAPARHHCNRLNPDCFEFFFTDGARVQA